MTRRHPMPATLEPYSGEDDTMATDQFVAVFSVAAATAACMGLLGGMSRDLAAAASDEPGRQAKADDAGSETKPAFRPAGVRYQVQDVGRSVAFYTKHLGFTLKQQSG